MGDATAGSVSAAGPVRVFMSYRRADDRHFIGRLHDRLCEAFGDEMVFRDIDSIPAGTNFRNVILRTLNEVDAVVAVIGPNWARPSDDDEAVSTDYVFLELAEALKFGKPVIPVLMEATQMPAAEVLPQDLRMLSDIEAISVFGDPAFRRDSARLIEAIGAVVAADRARIARAQQEADERARRLAAERLERERRAEELRAEERAARARLAELEEAAVRRQIEAERARVEALAEQLRQAELAEQAEPAVTAAAAAAEAPPAPESMPMPAAPVERPKVFEPPETGAGPSTVTKARPAWARPHLPWFQVLIVIALILGVASLSLNRSAEIDGTVYQFNELGGTTVFDVIVWVFVLAIGMPLLLGRRRVDQRGVLVGVTASLVLFEFLQEASVVRYGTSGFSEGSWYFVRFLQVVCLVGAYWILHQRSAEHSARSRRQRVPLLLIAVAGGVLTIAATGDEWNHTTELVDSGFVPGRSPLVVWIVLVALAPIAVTVALAARGSYASLVALATIATLAALNYYAQARFVALHDIDRSRWMWTAASYLLLAGVAWWAVIARARSKPSTI